MDDYDEAARHWGSVLRVSRLGSALTQEELAERSGRSVRCIRELEAGRVPRPRASTVRLLVDALAEHGEALGATARQPPRQRHGDGDGTAIAHAPARVLVSVGHQDSSAVPDGVQPQDDAGAPGHATAERRARPASSSSADRRGIGFALLGPFEVRRGPELVPVTASRQRTVLAALLLEANRPISVDRLVDVVWGEHPPPTAVLTLRTYVQRLRGILAGHRAADPDRRLIATCPGGYRLDVPPHAVDVLRFSALIDRARAAARAGDRASAIRDYREALGLCRGELLADLSAADWITAQAARLTDLQLSAVEELVDLELAAPGQVDCVRLVAPLVERWPLRETLRARLIRALHRSDRTAEALDQYRSAREVLIAEVGVEPGRALRAAHREALGGVGAEEPATPRPAQLPARLPRLAGRSDELARLDTLLDGDPGAVAVAAVSGTAGVGKTALAVHWAHRVADRFPDGQLYVNLRGFDPSLDPVSPGDALHGFLTALGVREHGLPRTTEERAALYRSLLTGRRMLVLLDNARDADHVRALLPAGAGSLAVVTSRDQLLPLVSETGARPVPLGLLGVDGSQALLSQFLGCAPVRAEPEATDEVIDRCAGLPLALTIVAARAATQARPSLGAIATELRDPSGALDALCAGAPTADVREVLSWSTRRLAGEPRRVFRLLALHPGPDVTAASVASLAAVGRSRASALLAELGRAQLLTEYAPGRLTFHDLLRTHARELVEREESPRERQAASRRIIDHYLHSTRNARRLEFLAPSTIPELPATAPG